MPRKRRRPSKLHLFTFLLGLSALAIFLPRLLTGRFGQATQVLVPMQDSLSAMTMPGRAAGSNALEQLERQNQAFRNQIASMASQIQELQSSNLELSRIRQLGFTNGRLIPARIVAFDSLPWRESPLVDQGTLKGVRKGLPVVSSLFVNVGDEDGVRDGMTILSGEVLVGEIAHAYTHTSRVVMISDVDARARLVRIGRARAGTFEFLDLEFLLHGVGGSRMQIRGIDHDLVESQQIKVRDIVVSAQGDQWLPHSVMVGYISDMTRDDDNSVLFNLMVEPITALDQLGSVYVVDLLGEM